jgi:hypothetical protein
MEIADPPKQRVQAAARPIGGMPGGRGVGRGAMPLGNSQGGAAGLAASLMQRLQQAQAGPGAQQQPAAIQVRARSACVPPHAERVYPHAERAEVVMPLLRLCGSAVPVALPAFWRLGCFVLCHDFLVLLF